MRCPPTYMLTPDIYVNYPTENAVLQLLRLDVTAESSSGWNDLVLWNPGAATETRSQTNSAAVSARVRRFILPLKYHILQFFMDSWFCICPFKSWTCEIFKFRNFRAAHSVRGGSVWKSYLFLFPLKWKHLEALDGFSSSPEDKRSSQRPWSQQKQELQRCNHH